MYVVNIGDTVRMSEAEVDVWCAPEIETEISKITEAYLPQSDIWSLGLLIHYVATNECPFTTNQEAREAISDDHNRRLRLGKYQLHTNCPMLFDLLERMVRPIANRAELSNSRCHPFLWTTHCKKQTLLCFADIAGKSPADLTPAMETFMEQWEVHSPRYVFGNAM